MGTEVENIFVVFCASVAFSCQVAHAHVHNGSAVAKLCFTSFQKRTIYSAAKERSHGPARPGLLPGRPAGPFVLWGVLQSDAWQQLSGLGLNGSHPSSPSLDPRTLWTGSKLRSQEEGDHFCRSSYFTFLFSPPFLPFLYSVTKEWKSHRTGVCSSDSRRRKNTQSIKMLLTSPRWTGPFLVYFEFQMWFAVDLLLMPLMLWVWYKRINLTMWDDLNLSDLRSLKVSHTWANGCPVESNQISYSSNTLPSLGFSRRWKCPFMAENLPFPGIDLSFYVIRVNLESTEHLPYGKTGLGNFKKKWLPRY